jgi:hypothetical protein
VASLRICTKSICETAPLDGAPNGYGSIVCENLTLTLFEGALIMNRKHGR